MSNGALGVEGTGLILANASVGGGLCVRSHAGTELSSGRHCDGLYVDELFV